MPSSPSLSERLIRSGYKEFQDRDAELTNARRRLLCRRFTLVVLVGLFILLVSECIYTYGYAPLPGFRTLSDISV